MATPRIRRGARAHLYIEEWMDARGLNDEKVANRIGVDRATVNRWRNQQHRLNPEKMAILAEALDLEGTADLFRPPARPSLDSIVRDAPEDVQAMAADIVRRMVGKAS